MNETQLNQALNAANTALGQVSNTIGAANLDKINRKFATEQAEKQREWNEQMWEKTNAWNYAMWKETNEYNIPTAQRQRLLDAGLNPLYYGLDGSSANGLEASQPLGYERADYNSTINPIQVGLDTQIAMRSLAKDVELKDAQIDKLKEDTKSTGLDNEWKDKTMDARVQAESLANNLTKENIKEVRKKIDVMEQDIKKKIAETDNEIERKALIQAETALKNASEKEIMSLLPYRQLLIEAETLAQKAAASASYMHAAYEKGMIDSGYIDSLAEEMKQRAKLTEKELGIKDAEKAQRDAEAALAAWKASVKNGTLYTGDTWFESKVLAPVLNGLVSSVSTISEALGGSLVPLAGAGLVGKGLSKAGTVNNIDIPGSNFDNRQQHGAYTVLYGSDGKPLSNVSW